MPTRRTSRGEKKRQQLRRAAFSCFSANGYHDTTVEQIVELADTSKGSFYWHYDSKLDVLVDILEVWGRDVMEALFERFEPIVHKDLRLFGVVESIGEAMVEELERGREMIPLWLEFTALAPREPQVAGALAAYYVEGRKAIVDMFDPMIGDAVDEETRRGIAAALYAFYLGLLMQELPDPERGSAPVFVRRVLRAVSAGFSLVEQNGIRSSNPVEPVPANPPHTSLLRKAGGRLRGHLAAIRALILDAVPTATERVDGDTGALVFDADGPLCALAVKDGLLELRFFHQVGDDLALDGLDVPLHRPPVLRVGPDDRLDPTGVRELLLVVFARRPR